MVLASRDKDFAAMQEADAATDYEQVIECALRVLENPSCVQEHIEALRRYAAALVRRGHIERAMAAYREMEFLCQEEDNSDGGNSVVLPLAKQVALFYLLGHRVTADTMVRLLEKRLCEADMAFARRIISHTRW